MKKHYRLLFRGLFVLALIFFGLATKDLYQSLFKRQELVIEYGRSKNAAIKSVLDSFIVHIEGTTDSLAKEVAGMGFSDEKFRTVIKKQTSANPSCLGTTVAFVKDAFEAHEGLYSVYYDKQLDTIFRVDRLYDYTISGVETSIWYTNVIGQQKGVWSDPYFPEGAKQICIDYGTQLVKDDKVIGVLCYTLSLSSFSQFLKNLSEGVSGYGFIAHDTALVVHPKVDLVLDKKRVKKIFTDNPNFKKMSQMEAGHFPFLSNYTFQDATLFFSRLKNDWSIALVLNTSDVLSGDGYFVKRVMKFSLGLSFILFCVIVFFSIGHGVKRKRGWLLSALFSLLIILNIALFWVMRYTYNSETELNNRDKIVNNSVLKKMLNNYNEKLQKVQKEPPIQIPTGIQINEMDFKGAYDVALCGEVWQKIPLDLEVKKKTFQFPQKTPQGIAVRTNLLSKKKEKDYYLYRYEFTANLQIGFTYTAFPLDFRVINMRIKYPYRDDNVVLIPDLESYNILDPSFKPGVSHYINVPSSEITATFFTLNEFENKVDFTHGKHEGLNNELQLEFDILVKRNILNPVVTNLFPILVIAVLIFLLLFTIEKKDGELVEGSSLSVIQASGGFFFIIILAHIQLRKSIMAPDILYLESFYIVMYLIIALMATCILMIVKSDRYKVLEANNNLAIKIAYWPFVLLLFLIASVLFLY